MPCKGLKSFYYYWVFMGIMERKMETTIIIGYILGL